MHADICDVAVFEKDECVSVYWDYDLFVFFAGCILRLPIWGDAADDNCFDDEPYWEVRDKSFVHLYQEYQYQVTFQLVYSHRNCKVAQNVYPIN